MKSRVFILVFMTFAMSCKEDQQRTGALVQAMEIGMVQASQGAAQLNLDGVAYSYDDINWEKSRINYDGEDVRLVLRQESLPRIRFRFPDIHESLERQSEFKIPDVLRGGASGGYFNSPITLSFQVYEKAEDGLPTGVVSFHKGVLTASFIENRLRVEFEGEGRKAMDEEPDYFPIRGSMDLVIAREE